MIKWLRGRGTDLCQQSVELVRSDEDPSPAFQQSGEGAADRVHETAPRFHVDGQDAARTQQETQTVPHLGVFRVSVLMSREMIFSDLKTDQFST